MKIVVDTSVIIAVITNANHKQQLISLTQGSDLIAPTALHWEIGNAFSAMFKRKRASLDQAVDALSDYRKIPINFIDIELEKVLEISFYHNIYAYDAYFLVCALQHKSPILSLDNGLINIAKKIGIKVIEVIS